MPKILAAIFLIVSGCLSGGMPGGVAAPSAPDNSAVATVDPAKLPAPPVDKGTISPSGKFTPVDPALADIAARAAAQKEEEARQRATLNIHATATNTFLIGRVEFDPAQRTITLPGHMKIIDQPIEYALVTENGKAYESLLTTDAGPMEIHLAFLLLGVGTVDVSGAPGRAIPMSASNTLGIEISWQTNNLRMSHGLSELMAMGADIRQAAGQPMPAGIWGYTGSVLDGQGFAAQHEGSIISLIRDPAALVNNTGGDRDNDKIHFPNALLLPPTGWPVSIIFHLPQKANVADEARVFHPATGITPLSTNKF